MDRKDFLKTACRYGVCGCLAIPLLDHKDLSAAVAGGQAGSEPDWRIGFMQSRFKDLMEILGEKLDEPTLIAVLEKLGSRCTAELAAKFKNDPEGLFKFFKSHWVDTIEFDKEKGIIRVNDKKQKTCGCPFVKDNAAPAILCHCSMGSHKSIYESAFGRPVDVALEKSILKGDERCSFTIQLL